MSGARLGALGGVGNPTGGDGAAMANRNVASETSNPRSGALVGTLGKPARPPGIEGGDSPKLGTGKLHIRARPSR
jgi:hypothetical protein